MKKCHIKRYKSLSLNFSRILFFVSFLIAVFISPALHSSPSLADSVFEGEKVSDVNTISDDSIPQLITLPLLTTISADVCACVGNINENRRPTEIEQDMEACFSMGIVNHFEALEKELGDFLFNGTDLNFEMISQLGLQLGDNLYRNCPGFSKLVH